MYLILGKEDPRETAYRNCTFTRIANIDYVWLQACFNELLFVWIIEIFILLFADEIWKIVMNFANHLNCHSVENFWTFLFALMNAILIKQFHIWIQKWIIYWAQIHSIFYPFPLYYKKILWHTNAATLTNSKKLPII